VYADMSLAAVREGYAKNDRSLGVSNPFAATVATVGFKGSTLPELRRMNPCVIALGRTSDGMLVLGTDRRGMRRTVDLPVSDAIVTLHPDATRCPDWPKRRDPDASALRGR